MIGTIRVMLTRYCSIASSTAAGFEVGHEHGDAAARGDAEHAGHRRGVEHRRLVEVDAVLVEADRDGRVIQVEHLGALFEQHTLRPPGGSARVHEDHRVGLVGLRWHDWVARLEQLLVPDIVWSVPPADEHHALDVGVVSHRINDAREERVDEHGLCARVAEDERQLGRTEPQVQRIDDSGAKETRVVQLEVLVPVPRDDRVPVASSHPELGLHRGCQAQRPLEMHAERPVVGTIVEADPVGGAVRGREQQPPVYEFFHTCTVGTPGRSAPLGPSDRSGRDL